MYRLTLGLISLLCGLLLWSSALAIVPDDLGGRIEAQVNGKSVTLPLLKTDIDADVQDDLLTQLLAVRDTAHDALAKGKAEHDKRNTIKEREGKREVERIMKSRHR